MHQCWWKHEHSHMWKQNCTKGSADLLLQRLWNSWTETDPHSLNLSLQNMTWPVNLTRPRTHVQHIMPCTLHSFSQLAASPSNSQSCVQLSSKHSYMVCATVCLLQWIHLHTSLLFLLYASIFLTIRRLVIDRHPQQTQTWLMIIAKC